MQSQMLSHHSEDPSHEPTLSYTKPYSKFHLTQRFQVSHLSLGFKHSGFQQASVKECRKCQPLAWEKAQTAKGLVATGNLSLSNQHEAEHSKSDHYVRDHLCSVLPCNLLPSFSHAHHD